MLAGVVAAGVQLEEFDAAVFDLDGVVSDTARVHASAWAELFNAFLTTVAPGMAPFDDEDYVRYVDGKSRVDGVTAFLAARHIDIPFGRVDDPPTTTTVCGLASRKDELFLARLRCEGVVAFPGTVAFVRHLRSAGKQLAVVSSSRNCCVVLDAAGVADLFDLVVDGVTATQEGLAGKPDPATFLFAVRRLGTTPARTLLVEDALAGVQAGRRGGFGLVVGVDRRHHGDDLRRAGADLVVRDVAELLVAPPTVSDIESDNWVITRDLCVGDPHARAHEALFALGDGTVGVRGDIEDAGAASAWLTVAAGAYGIGPDDMVRLLPGPSLAPLVVDDGIGAPPDRHVLDLRAGTLRRGPSTAGAGLRTTRFVSLTRPGVVALRAEAEPGRKWTERPLLAPRLGADAAQSALHSYEEGAIDHGGWWAATRSDRAEVVAVASQRTGDGPSGSWLERVMVVRSGTDAREDAESTLSDAKAAGFTTLLTEHSRAWAARWDAADIEIDGDPDTQEALRFALFHLLSCAPPTGEAGVSARGLTGLAYAGHVFWDAEVFVLPALAATIPEAARAMIEYRIRRLDAARGHARARGEAGARFPWESADTGEDVTPASVRGHAGKVVPIVTGRHEEHINADIPWAVLHYVDWTGDTGLLHGPGGDLIVETARYWASRIRLDTDGRGHIYGVMGPDEYHEVVDDNAFTNLLVRWHLRQAADLLDPSETREAARWRALADALVVGYDPAMGCHEQFAGFWRLEPLRIADVADIPVTADMLLGPSRVAHAQILKQPDVLMAHHMLPAELPAGSLARDLDFYLPRTAHGSSLSPAICASLLARSGAPDEALALFDLAARIDLADLAGTTGGGLHLATLGGLWQAAVHGFAGIRPVGGVLHVEPALPTRWTRLGVRVRFRGVGVRVDITHDRITVDPDSPIALAVHGVALTGAGTVTRLGTGWRKT